MGSDKKSLQRIDGIVVVLVAVLYGWGGWQIEESRVGIQDRVGPAFFPLGVALLLLVCGVVMILRRDGVDHRRVWPHRSFWKPFFTMLGVLVLYSFFFDAVGFFIINTLLCLYLGKLLKGDILPSLISGIAISLGIFILFSIILEINLSYGVLEFIENWIYEY